jgi:predicted amidohydrolase
MKGFTVAATQVVVRQADVQGNLEVHAEVIRQTAAAGCDLVVFPELSVTGHNGSPDVIKVAEPLDGPIFRAMYSFAAQHAIVVSYGFAELFRGTHYNTSAIVGPQGLVGVQRKVHASFDEFLRFRQAYEWNVSDLGFAKAGTAICHDSDFFEVWRILSLRGADVVLLPHADRKRFAADGRLSFDGADRETPTTEILQAQRELMDPLAAVPRFHDVAARDNGVFAVYSDQVGFDGHTTHAGGAYILGPDGATLARSDLGTETSWIKAFLDPALLLLVRENPSFALRKRRPETYGELTVQL